VIDEVIPEPAGGAHNDHGAAAAQVKKVLRATSANEQAFCSRAVRAALPQVRAMSVGESRSNASWPLCRRLRSEKPPSALAVGGFCLPGHAYPALSRTFSHACLLACWPQFLGACGEPSYRVRVLKRPMAA